ncbi:hypothetical protein NJB1907f44_32300 [Mycobacterium marinum]|nr:hypothetical protein NJB1907f34b_09820 [Mycobacterium marinum]GJO10340.1 hypothetical protein NJB1907E90_28650 [Mycobacterium marinum]GJO10923.1 hypothetical protein NJB1808e29_47290 [Mycobacterium marinum]GJO15467.1 hypothetical protein NJB1907E11_14340 [Mycobacterium marinum]GJO21322.1 hypothetical protein NJB1907f22_02300 [Mycobacterium marinum]
MADVVHQDVDAAVAIEHALSQRADLIGIADVGADCPSRTADFVDGAVGKLRIDISDDDLGAVLGE